MSTVQLHFHKLSENAITPVRGSEVRGLHTVN